MEEVALLLAFDDAHFAARCEATVYALREQGNYSGPIELVGPDGTSFSRDYRLRIRTLAEVVGTSGVPLEPPQPCATLPEKRLSGWHGYYFKMLATMSSFWAARYRRLVFVDCGMHVHRSLEPLVRFDPGKQLAAHSAAYPEYAWGMDHVIHAECGNATARALARAYPRAARGDFFQSTLMAYRTQLLGSSGDTLREVAALYHRYGGIVEGDQARKAPFSAMTGCVGRVGTVGARTSGTGPGPLELACRGRPAASQELCSPLVDPLPYPTRT